MNEITQSSNTRKITRSSRLVFEIIVVTASFAYFPIFLGPFQFDDYYYVIGAPWAGQPLHEFLSFLSVNLNRLTSYISFWFDSQISFYLFGELKPGWFHITNLLIHIVNAMLMYCIVNNLFPFIIASKHRAQRAAIFAALIFLLHPIQTSAVCYVSQRFELISCLCCLLCLDFYLQNKAKQHPVKLLASLVFFALALFSKETSYSFILLLFFLEAFLFNPQRWKEALTFALALLISVVVGLAWAHEHNFSIALFLRQDSTIARLDYAFFQLGALYRYLSLVLIPVGLNLDYDPSPPSALSATTLVAVSIALTTVFWKIRKRQPIFLLLLVWFFSSLAVSSSIIPIRDIVVEHRVYPAMGAIAVLMALGFEKLYSSNRKTALCLSSVILLSLASITFDRTALWSNEVALWKDTVAKSPRKARPRANLGIAYMNSGQADLASEHLKEAGQLALAESSPDSQTAEILSLAAAAALNNAELEKAREFLTVAVRIYSAPSILYNLGVLALKEANAARAKTLIDRANFLFPQCCQCKAAAEQLASDTPPNAVSCPPNLYYATFKR